MPPFYRAILKKAWYLSFQNIWLWVLGGFACLLGNGSLYQLLTRSFSNISEGGSLVYTLAQYVNSGLLGLLSWSTIKSVWAQDPSTIGMWIFSIVLGLSALILFVSLGVIGQAGALRGLVREIEGRKASLKESFLVGVEHFKTVLAINIFTKVVIFGLLLVIMSIASLFAYGEVWLSWTAFVLSLLIFITVSVIIYFLTIYSTLYAVLRGSDAKQSILSGWKLFSAHLWLNIEVGLIMFALGLLVTFVFAAVLLVGLGPVVLAYGFALYFAVNWLSALLAVIIAIVLIAAVIVGSAWFSTYSLAVWAILFEEMDAGRGFHKLGRVVAAVKQRLHRP